MLVSELKDLSRKETPLHYIREFHATATLEGGTGRRDVPLAFTIEKKPVGQPEISVRFLEEPDWPLLPLIRSLKEMILDLDRKGDLP